MSIDYSTGVAPPHPSPCGTTFSASRITGELCRNRIGPQPKETRQSPLPTHLIITRSVPPLTVRLCVVRVCCREKVTMRKCKRKKNKMAEMVTGHVASGASPLDLGNHGRTIIELIPLLLLCPLVSFVFPMPRQRTQQSRQVTRQCKLQLNLPRLINGEITNHKPTITCNLPETGSMLNSN